MFLDFAPMEGITTALFRQTHQQFFPGVDRYFSPFLSPTQDRRFTPREQREFFPEYNEGIPLIPQILTKNPDDFLWAAGELFAMGYQELNLNLGCPSGTVTAKGKGAGMLANPQALDRFLDTIFSSLPCKLSIKTRLGLETPEEFESILKIYNRYPISELIIHPRVRRDFYRHPVRMAFFDYAIQHSRNPLSYNGSVITPQDYDRIKDAYPNLTGIMIGQGLVSDPFLASKIKNGTVGTIEQLAAFHDTLFERYSQQFGSANNTVKRMKDIWFYLSRLFADSDHACKQILKSKNEVEYRLAVHHMIHDLPMLPASAGGW